MSSGFISEAEITEQRRMRQEEWERVRTADQPLEAPEETYDPRSLYERLQEQKNKRDIEYEEAHKLSRLDDDEVEFLDLVDRTKMEEERKKNLEEEKEMRDFKAAVASLQEQKLNEKLKQELKNPHVSSKREAHKGIKRKTSLSESEPTAKEMKTSSEATSDVVPPDADKQNDKNVLNKVSQGTGLKCIGILPGLGTYEDSSDSDCTSDTDQETEPSSSKYDMLGRKIKTLKDKEKS
ncbi:hypothetical protein X777_04111 [Ooceraea biroi]|uniref:FAM192A/Fyv6 N-terminal domain-containing protein n=1 Tax=Ooceraea biroi TaxID=2015173 RepID=A0A026WIM0_OOCBI|nr:hypothetical protein X777_04111 [Ooceraea biroi]